MQRQSNSRLTVKLFWLSVLIALSLSVCNISTYALCLSAGKLRLIVWAELAASISLPLSAGVYARLCRRFSVKVVQTAVFALSVIGLLVSAAAVSHVPVAVLALPLLLLTKLHGTFANLAFWSVATAQRSGQDPSHSLGLASAGFPVGWLAGGLVCLVLGELASTDVHLILAASAVFLATLVLFTFHWPAAEKSRSAETHAEQRNRNCEMPSSNQKPGTRMVYVLCSISVISSSLVGFLCNSSITECIGERAAITRYLGLMDVVTGAAQFMWAAFFTDRILRRFGAIAGMIAVPWGMACCVLLFLVGFHVSGTDAMVLGIASITRMGDIVLRKSLEKPSFAAYCQRFSDERRQQVLRTFELVVKPLAATAAAILVTAVNVGSGRQLATPAWLCLSFLVVWVFVAAFFARQHIEPNIVTCDERTALAHS